MYFLNYYTLGIIFIPALLLAIYAEAKVYLTYNKYTNSHASCGKPAHEIARLFLDAAGLHDIKIVAIRGHLTDYYNHRTKTIALSESVYNSNSIAAIGIACHEVGHALQYKNGYFPIKFRNVLIPICNFGSKLLWMWIIFSIFSLYFLGDGGLFIDIGVVVVGLFTLLNLVTLPVEFNASKRAVALLNTSGTLSDNECVKVKKVLNAAALTYVAAFVMSLLQFLRFIIILKDRD